VLRAFLATCGARELLAEMLLGTAHDAFDSSYFVLQNAFRDAAILLQLVQQIAVSASNDW